MLVMSAKISFPDADRESGKTLVIRTPSSVHIDSSVKSLTKNATIVLPRNVSKLFDKYKVSEVFRRGDRVTIELGYDGQLSEEFSGYISKGVSADIPIKIECQDEMWKLKQLPVNYVAKGVTLKSLLKAICKGYTIDALDSVALGTVRFSKTTVAAVLEKLSKDWKINTFMDGKTIVSGDVYGHYTSTSPIKYNLERTVVNNDLNYKQKDDVTLKLTAESILVNGRKLSVVLGQDGGDQMHLTYYNITAKAELEKKAKTDYEKAIAGGFDGTITAFGTPRCQIGWKVQLVSTIYPDRNGIYYVEAVSKDWNEQGFRQKINLGAKVS